MTGGGARGQNIVHLSNVVSNPYLDDRIIRHSYLYNRYPFLKSIPKIILFNIYSDLNFHDTHL